MSILLEQNMSKVYHLKTYKSKVDKNIELVELTLDNVARVEAMIKTDSKYRKSSLRIPPVIKEYVVGGEKHAKGSTKIQHHGSTRYWMEELKYLLDNHEAMNLVFRNKLLGTKHCGTALVELFDKTLKEEIITIEGINGRGGDKSKHYTLEIAIYGAVSAVDRENSTHLTSDQENNKNKNALGNGRIELTKRLFEMITSGLNLLDILRDGRLDIIDELRKITKSAKRQRQNYSFATKFCHYACICWFRGTKYADNYSIYDNILGEAITYYARQYGIKCEKIQHLHNDYKIYSEVVDSIRKAAKKLFRPKISRNGFDHLLWYYHKGHPIKEN